MKIITLLSEFAPGDAVSNDALAIHRFLTDSGLITVMAAEKIYYQPEGVEIMPLHTLSFIEPEDIVIYHLSTGTELNYAVGDVKCKKVIRYHNITPFEFFCGYSNYKVATAQNGLRGAAFLANKADLCICDSEYNQCDLRKMGYQCPIVVVPILIAFDDYKKEPDKKLLKQLQDGNHHIIFTGRIAPNKRQEDVILAFYYYQKYFDNNARLHLVGNYAGFEDYYLKLADYVKRLQLKNVEFTGHITFAKLLAYYRSADLFLCMSDHEGFCVPLVEAMYFGIPIIAKDTSAIAGTLGDAGLLLSTAEPKFAAGLMHRVLSDDNLKNKIIESESLRLKNFTSEDIKKQLLSAIERVR